MFEVLREAVETLEIPATGDALRAVWRLVDQVTARAREATAEFDALDGPAAEGALSTGSWLKHHTGMDDAVAGRHLKAGRRLRHWPVTAAAARSGELSASQVEVICAQVPARSVERWAEHEAIMVPEMIGGDVAQSRVAMTRWRQLIDGVDDEKPPVERNDLYLSVLPDGRQRIDGNLDHKTGAVVGDAIRAAMRPDLEGEPERTPSRRRADALGDICAFWLAHQSTPPTARQRPSAHVVIDWDALAGSGRPGTSHWADGTPISNAAIAQVLCDANVHRLIVTGVSTILDYGRGTKAVPPNLWIVIALRDRHCRFPGCDVPSPRCDAHHVVHWLHGGPTNPTNIVLLCERHHTVIHLPGYQMKLLPDATVEVTLPTGRTLTSHPPPLTGTGAGP